MWHGNRSDSLTIGRKLNMTGMSKAEKTLNELVQFSIDAQKRYRNAADHASISELEVFLRAQSERRQAAAVELQGAILRMGGEPRDSGTLKGDIERLGIDASVAMSMGDSGLVDWCRDEAENLEEHYQEALSEDLPLESRTIVARQAAALRETIGELDGILAAYGGPRS
jgi:uncharacterized protein (TIGR02284 family)